MISGCEVVGIAEVDNNVDRNNVMKGFLNNKKDLEFIVKMYRKPVKFSKNRSLMRRDMKSEKEPR